MSLSRTLNVVVVVFVLLVLAVPAAQARTLDTSSRVLRPVDGSWLAASMSWLTQFFGIQTPAPSFVPKLDTTITATITVILRPNTGSCIDPNGCHLGG
jgi:uncharacterized membrane protein